jgi:hypothetical protein
MKLQTTYISVHSSERTNTVCGDHSNEVISLQNHAFLLKTMGKRKESQYNNPINAGKTLWLLEGTLNYKVYSRVKDMSDISRKRQIRRVIQSRCVIEADIRARIIYITYITQVRTYAGKN